MVWGALRPRPGAVGAMVLLLLCKFGGSRHAVGLLVLVCFVNWLVKLLLYIGYFT